MVPSSHQRSSLVDLDAQLAEVLLVPHILVGLLSLIESEDLLINNGLNVVRLNGTVHLLKLLPASHQHTAYGADVVEALEESRLLLALGTTEETNDGDHAVERNGFEGLGHGVGSADFEDVLNTTAAGCELLGFLAPVGDFLVVDDVVGTESLELLALFGGGGGGNDLCASGFGELDREHADAASTLGEDPVTGLQTAALETVQAVPCSKTGASQGAALQEVEVGGHGDEALLAVGAILLESTIDGATNASSHGLVVQRASEMALVEQSEHLVALLEAGHARADSLDDTSSVRCGNNTGTESEWVETLDDGEIAVVERGAVDCQSSLALEVVRIVGVDDVREHTLDKNIVLADLGHRCISGELQAIEASELSDSPLLLSRRHVVY